MSDVSWIRDEDALADAVASCGRVVALDTEFQRTSTFFPIAGLYQLASAEQIWLIDPLEIEDFGPFLELLEDRSVVKVMHACSEDLELLRHHLGAVPRGLFDTQFAYAFVSDRYSISLAALVEHYEGVAMESSQTRSNWLRRPLSDAQIHYAAEDVRYLVRIHDRLVEELAEKGRLEWFEQDMAERGDFRPPDPETYYLGVGKAWSLAEHELARLQSLCAWRERTAMTRDMPRRRVLEDDQLLAMARVDRLDVQDLTRYVSNGLARRYGEEIVEAHGHTLAPEALSEVPKPLTQGESAKLKKLRAAGVAQAEDLGLAQELLARKRDVEALYRHFRAHGTLDERFAGWRKPIVGDLYQQMLAGSR